MHSSNEEIRRTLDQLQHAIDQIQVREFNFHCLHTINPNVLNVHSVVDYSLTTIGVFKNGAPLYNAQVDVMPDN